LQLLRRETYLVHIWCIHGKACQLVRTVKFQSPRAIRTWEQVWHGSQYAGFNPPYGDEDLSRPGSLVLESERFQSLVGAMRTTPCSSFARPDPGWSFNPS
jgi:hypothetical protein